EWVRQKVGDGESRLRLMPKTGRSHQLRVHCLSMGHPILGDPLYAPQTADAYPRMMLHAEEIRLNHPENAKGMKFRTKTQF
ncbi:MAG: RNA pseudouridine synthase, partial [Paracoccaceae bacterium]